MDNSLWQNHDRFTRRPGVVAHRGKENTPWAAAHISNVVEPYALARESDASGARHHVSVVQDVDARVILEAAGKGTGLPARSIATQDIARYLGRMVPFASCDVTASNVWTRARFGWEPAGPDLLTDLAAMACSAPTRT